MKESLKALVLIVFCVGWSLASVLSEGAVTNATRGFPVSDEESSIFSEETSEQLSSSEEGGYPDLYAFAVVSAGFVHATIAAVSVIVVSELGDKTFFIAVILAMKSSRILVFLGAIVALVLMTVLSAALGQLTTIIPRVYVHYTSVILFIVFGLKMIKEGYSMSASHQGEYDDAHKEIENRESQLKANMNDSVELGVKVKRKSYVTVSLVFTMTFLAEWGDRSQLTTIVLAARENVYGVIFGAIVGHAACTFLAVVGGRLISDRISVKLVTLIGGIVFLAFAVWAVAIGPGTSLDDETNFNLLHVTKKDEAMS